jgi:hypothetical protein
MKILVFHSGVIVYIIFFVSLDLTGSKLVCGCGLVWLRDLVRRKPSVVTEAR